MILGEKSSHENPAGIWQMWMWRKWSSPSAHHSTKCIYNSIHLWADKSGQLWDLISFAFRVICRSKCDAGSSQGELCCINFGVQLSSLLQGFIPAMQEIKHLLIFVTAQHCVTAYCDVHNFALFLFIHKPKGLSNMLRISLYTRRGFRHSVYLKFCKISTQTLRGQELRKT